VLAGITGIAIDPSSELILPVIPDNMTDDLSRPELELFDLRKQQLDAGLDMINSKRMPKAFGFATLGYGNPPGNNFFKDEFAPYYIMGAGIKWNVFDWKKAATEKQVIKLQQGIIENRKTDMADNLKRVLEVKKSEINSINTMLNSDSELVSLRQKITVRAESQYENGIITATELLNEINSEKLALINFELHKVSLAMAKVEYLNISGKDIE
jgi:outer membrane protein TolC